MFFRAVSLPVALAVSPVVFAAANWPAPKERLVAVAATPDKEVFAALMADADAAFDKHAYVDAIALRSLAKLTGFMAENPLPDGLRAWFVANRDVASDFAGELSRHDDAKAVAKILGDIWNADGKGFRAYPRLACAIALVYDRPPPPIFPHGQISPKVLPRKLNDPLEVFAFYREAADAHKLGLSPDRLAIDELAFVVGFVAPLSEMREALKMHVNRAGVEKLYFSVVYDKIRYTNRQYDWGDSSYALPAIKKRGGICVDQAYYASTVAQANGIPAFILTGSGSDGNHAFVGYLASPGKWKNDVGRYAGQNYATGTALNPLIWGELTDHEMAMIQDKIRDTASYATAGLFAEKAAEAVAAKNFDVAQKLLDAGRSADARNAAVWNVAAALAANRGDGLDKQERLYAAAADALSKYRELATEWTSRLADTLEKEGKLDEAIDRRLAVVRRNSRARPEIAVRFAEKLMENALKVGDARKDLQLFGRLANQFDIAGMEFLRSVAYPYVAHLVQNNRQKDAKSAARIISLRFKYEKGSQLEELKNALVRMADTGKVEKPTA